MMVTGLGSLRKRKAQEQRPRDKCRAEVGFALGLLPSEECCRQPEDSHLPPLGWDMPPRRKVRGTSLGGLLSDNREVSHSEMQGQPRAGPDPDPDLQDQGSRSHGVQPSPVLLCCLEVLFPSR